MASASQPADLARELVSRNALQRSLSQLLEPERAISIGSIDICEDGACAGVRPTGLSSSLATAILIGKTCFGVAFLLMPRGFHNVGIIGGPLCLGVVYVFMLYGMLKLIECRRVVGPGCSFADLGETAFGFWGRRYIMAAIISLHFGFTCIWSVTMSENLSMVLTSLSPTARLWLFCPLSLALAPARHMRFFVGCSFMGIIFCLVTCGYVAVFATSVMVQQGGPRKMVLLNMSSGDSLIWLGTCAYMFESICSLLPIYEQAAEKDKIPKLLTCITFCIVCLYVAFGLLVYASFGEDTKEMATLNLPHGSFAGYVFPLCFALVGAVTTPVLFFVMYQTYEPELDCWSHDATWRKWQKNLVRWLVIFASYAATWLGGQQLQNFLGVVGGLLGGNLALLVPTALHLAICKPSGFVLLVDVSTVIVGIVVMVASTYQAIATWK